MFVYGHPPFVASSIPELYSKIQASDLNSTNLCLKSSPVEYKLSSGGNTVSPDLIDLLQHVLDKNPATRYAAEQIGVPKLPLTL